MNRDSREIFGLYRFYDRKKHYRLLRRALNAAIILCEDFCIMPPGFAIEDEIAFDLLESQKEYLRSRLIRFPMRESNLADYAEKKRIEYLPMRDRYSGLFSDPRIEFLGRNADGLISRKANIGEHIVSGWREGADTRKKLWLPVKKVLGAKEITSISEIPAQLSLEGTALTWAAISPRIHPGAKEAEPSLRNVLQFTYFNQYCQEFGLIVLTSIPTMVEEFHLPRIGKSYNYQRLSEFLDVFYMRDFLLDASSEFLSTLVVQSSFTSFIDAFVALADKAESAKDMRFWASGALAKCRFNFREFTSRYNVFVEYPQRLELLELEHGLDEATGLLTSLNGLPLRATSLASRPASIIMVDTLEKKPMPPLAIFVALQEELKVLAEGLGLQRNATQPYASGRVGDVEIDVICPRDMGRVAAAVEVTSYLEKRKANPPRLLLIVGLAGGFAENGSATGHIICASKVVDLALRKVRDEREEAEGGARPKSQFRRREFVMSHALRDVTLSDGFDKKGWVNEAIDAAEWPDDKRPSLTYGPMTSIDEIVASDAWRAEILSQSEKFLGVEMEAGGACAAAEKFAVRYAMLRVVSDYADPSKADDSWRRTGMKTLTLLLKRLPLAAVLSA